MTNQMGLTATDPQDVKELGTLEESEKRSEPQGGGNENGGPGRREGSIKDAFGNSKMREPPAWRAKLLLRAERPCNNANHAVLMSARNQIKADFRQYSENGTEVVGIM
ncbi:hypothetical protein PM082_004654 [Marasmius tenuissimus]|nr:hypothetical protein PM082_004654 [Marasmius tenuissimus]